MVSSGTWPPCRGHKKLYHIIYLTYIIIPLFHLIFHGELNKFCSLVCVLFVKIKNGRLTQH